MPTWQLPYVAGVVTSVEFAGEEFTVVPPLPERFVPVEELFALLQDAVRRNAARIEVSYDESLRLPRQNCSSTTTSA